MSRLPYVRRLALLGTVLVLFLLGGAGTASAHAALKGATPADGSVLDSEPKDVTLTFTEPVSLLQDSIRVIDPENRAVDTSKPGRSGDRSDTARVTLPAGLADGTYTVAWRVISADSHPISGALLFSVGEPSATSATLPADLAEDPLTASFYDITRYFAYGALALLIGVTVFVTAVLGRANDTLRKLLLSGWLALTLSSVVLLLLRGPYERGSGVGAVLDPSVLGGTVGTRPGLALLARLTLLAVVLFFLVRVRAQVNWGRGAAGAGVLLSVGLAGTWAAAEHASAGIQVPVAMTSSVLHLLAMAVWLGGLTALLTVLYRAPETLSAAVVTRFSRLAFASVVVLVVTGVYQSWRGLGSWSAFTTTAYGQVLLAKLAVVALLLAAAAFSRRWTARLGAVAVGVNAENAESAESAESGEGARSGGAVVVEARVPQPVGAVARVDGGAGAEAPAVSTINTDTDTDTDSGSDSGSGSAEGTDAGSASTGKGTGAGAGSDSDKGTDAGTDADTDARNTPTEPADAHRLALRRSVLAEFTVAVVVLVITTVLTGTLPGRAAAESARGTGGAAAPGEVTASSTVVPFDMGTPNGHGKVQIDLGPGKVGKNSIQAVVFGPDDGIATVPELRLTFTLKAQKVGPIDAKLTDRGGYWATDTLQIPLPGTWTMKLTVRTTDIDQVTVEKNVKVG
ncbi:copper resistance CopC/CopD family protein [Streptomyces sp. NPDC008159]|uniref:copper resistance CopC/CopD family protein n=1 Tax=Streptomyces sp. NPDC008159 TaxID=3364817 RepID=UPI0036E61712